MLNLNITVMASLICVPITETNPDSFLKAIREADRIADAIELRLDYLDSKSRSQVISELLAHIEDFNKPQIFTFRPREQGGRQNLTLLERQDFWRDLPKELVEIMAFADFELDLAESFVGNSPIPWNKVISSWHNFEETPANIYEVYERLVRTPAAVVKIATQANHICDCLRLFELIERRVSKKPVIVLGMGMAGLMTRVLALSRGALLTFGALRRGAESAGGQPTIDELVNLYRVKRLSRDSEILGVIGNPIGHSRSPLMHNAALKALNRDSVYLPFEVDDINEFVRDFVRPATRQFVWRLRGLSVTIPHKLSIIPYLDVVDHTAERIGAVNTVVIEGNKLHGYNTDVIGAMKPLDDLIDVEGVCVAVLGAGGAARAICYGLCQRGADVTIYARELNRAQMLADDFKAKADLIDRFNGQADVIINCTPIGMHGHSEGKSPINSEHLRGVKLVYDLVYNPEETILLRNARMAGCQTLGGLAMLIEQAAEQFRLWTGEEPPIEVMRMAVENAKHAK